MEVCRFVHDGKTLVLKEVEDWRRVVRKLAATLMWLSGTEVPVVQVSQNPEVVEVAEIGVPLPEKSQHAPVEHSKDQGVRPDGSGTPHRW